MGSFCKTMLCFSILLFISASARASDILEMLTDGLFQNSQLTKELYGRTPVITKAQSKPTKTQPQNNDTPEFNLEDVTSLLELFDYDSFLSKATPQKKAYKSKKEAHKTNRETQQGPSAVKIDHLGSKEQPLSRSRPKKKSQKIVNDEGVSGEILSLINKIYRHLDHYNPVKSSPNTKQNKRNIYYSDLPENYSKGIYYTPSKTASGQKAKSYDSKHLNSKKKGKKELIVGFPQYSSEKKKSSGGENKKEAYNKMELYDGIISSFLDKNYQSSKQKVKPHESKSSYDEVKKLYKEKFVLPKGIHYDSKEGGRRHRSRKQNHLRPKSNDEGGLSELFPRFSTLFKRDTKSTNKKRDLKYGQKHHYSSEEDISHLISHILGDLDSHIHHKHHSYSPGHFSKHSREFHGDSYSPKLHKDFHLKSHEIYDSHSLEHYDESLLLDLEKENLLLALANFFDKDTTSKSDEYLSKEISSSFYDLYFHAPHVGKHNSHYK